MTEQYATKLPRKGSTAGARALALAVIVASITFAITTLAIPEARADRVTDLAEALANGKDARTRLVAAIGLARVNDKRAVGPFIRALRDTDKTIRGVAAAALGNLGDTRAIPALEKAVSDLESFVRERARESLDKLRPILSQEKRGTESVPKEKPRPAETSGGKKAFVVVKSTYNRATTGGKPLAAKMKTYLEEEVQGTRELSTDVGSRGKVGAFTIDGSITEMVKKTTTNYVEVTCNVRLVVGTYPDGRVVTMVNGGATVQMPRRSWKATMEPAVQLDALSSAVKGAHQTLVTFLLRQK